ncbi:MAG: PFL family protein, partial [Deltaproteobacteria bacterium]|nr:PFL family protein [Deltaproteobacteria bacterium]
MLTDREVAATLEMLKNEHLDVRTITLGLSLLDCASDDISRLIAKILDKISRHGENLVKTCDLVAEKYGIPVVNKRLAISPVAALAGPFNRTDLIRLAKALDKAASLVGVDFIGGYSALVEKGFSNGDLRLIESIPEALGVTSKVCSSINVASSQAGINMDAVLLMGRIIKETAEFGNSLESLSCARLVVFSNIPPDMPFMAGAYSGLGEPDAVINVGVSGPGVVKKAVDRAMGRSHNLAEGKLTKDIKRPSFGELSEVIKRTAYKVTRVGEIIGREVAEILEIPFGVVDLSLAPAPQVGDSVGEIFQSFGLKAIGAPGSTALLALLNDAVKKGGAFASSHVGGLSGAFIPVSEDLGIAAAVDANYLSLEKLEALTSVCSVGLDMVSLPGNTSSGTISAIIADEMAIGVVNHKTTACRLIPVPGKNAGDKVHYGGLLGEATIMAVADYSEAEAFVSLGGRMPAPIHSL